MTEQTPDVLTLNELAGYLRIPRSTAYKLVQKGRIPGQKAGRQWRFHRQVVDEWLRNRVPAKEGEQP